MIVSKNLCKLYRLQDKRADGSLTLLLKPLEDDDDDDDNGDSGGDGGACPCSGTAQKTLTGVTLPGLNEDRSSGLAAENL